VKADAARRGRHRKASGRRSPKTIGRATAGNDPPFLVVHPSLEERPVALVHTGSFEDEERLRRWLSSPTPRRSVLAALWEALDQIERRAA
jgi:hypothetical protein